MRKSESAVNRCRTISTVQKLLGGKYKIELLWYIGKCDIRRFGQLRRQIGEITESSLTKQLRELETDGFLLRHDFCEVPPRVEYTLTDGTQTFRQTVRCGSKGEALESVFSAIPCGVYRLEENGVFCCTVTVTDDDPELSVALP